MWKDGNMLISHNIIYNIGILCRNINVIRWKAYIEAVCMTIIIIIGKWAIYVSVLEGRWEEEASKGKRKKLVQNDELNWMENIYTINVQINQRTHVFNVYSLVLAIQCVLYPFIWNRKTKQ